MIREVITIIFIMGRKGLAVTLWAPPPGIPCNDGPETGETEGMALVKHVHLCVKPKSKV